MGGQEALWAAVLLSGLYHGLNPGMGWPLAVAGGLAERRGAAVAWTLAWLAAGHLLSVVIVLLPFAALTLLLDWSRAVRIAASIGILAFAAFLILYPRHPRWMARIRPRQVALWSFAVALLHGAGLMLVPLLLGLCTPIGSGMSVVDAPNVAGNVGLALGVALVHTLTLVLAGGTLAWMAYRTLGLGIVARSWFNLSHLWAGSLALTGALSLWSVL